MKKPGPAGWLALALAAVLAWAAARSLEPPAVRPDGAPAGEFSAERAFRHLAAIARVPRPHGAPGHEAAQRYILGELQRSGAEAQLHQAEGANVPLTNILGRLRGRQAGRSVLLVSHYDTVHGSPGAGDAGAGVAALLETLRALRAGPRLRNDVVFLFTDGEEMGLLGADSFVREHPWAREVGIILNFEARGNRGRSLLFETSPGNGPLIRGLARTGGPVLATSFSTEVYETLPNDTDFTIFRQAGLAGLNFALVQGSGVYHTPADTVEALDPRSLQHHGEYALSLARAFGEADLADGLRGGDVIFFDLLGSTVAWFPAWLVLPLALALLAGTVAVMVAGFRRRRLDAGGLLGALAALILGAPVAGYLALEASRLVAGGGAACLVLALSVLAVLAMSKHLGFGNAAVAGLAVWALLGAGLAVFAPGASYLVLLPLLPAVGAILLGGPWREGEEGRSVRIARALLPGLAAALAALLWTPALILVATALAGLGVAVAGGLLFLIFAGLLGPLALGA